VKNAVLYGDCDSIILRAQVGHLPKSENCQKLIFPNGSLDNLTEIKRKIVGALDAIRKATLAGMKDASRGPSCSACGSATLSVIAAAVCVGDFSRPKPRGRSWGNSRQRSGLSLNGLVATDPERKSSSPICCAAIRPFQHDSRTR
jgi:hypothetical protein